VHTDFWVASREKRRERAGGVGRKIDASARCVKGAAGRVLITGQFGLLSSLLKTHRSPKFVAEAIRHVYLLL